MHNSRLVASLALVFTLIWFSPSLAAGPDAGQLLNEQRQIMPSLPDRLPADGGKEIEKPPLEDQGIKVRVTGFSFSGTRGIATDAELMALVQDAVGKEVGLKELQALTDRITAYLREKGYLLARAYLPKQDVTDGRIEIAVIVGRIEGKSKIDVKEPRRISQNLLEGIAERAIPEGDVVRLENIERAVKLMGDLPGISAQASLEPGNTPGTSRVVIGVTERPLVTGYLSGDNYGDRYTGTWRGTGQAAINDPFGLGDQFSVSLTGAEHLFQGRVGYALPVGATGLVWSAGYTGLAYKLGEELASLDAKGTGQTFSTGLTYPVMRTRAASIWGGLGFEYLALHDEANGATTRDRKLPVGNLNFTGSFFDGFGGGGLTSLHLAFYHGNVDLSAPADAKAADDATARSAGNFARANYALARLQRVTKLISLYGSARGQFASQNLDSSQKFILGGPAGVRAYPVGEASGDEGHALTVETRVDLPFSPSWASAQLVGFYDAGTVRLHKNTWAGSVTNATGRNDYWLSGAGVGINVGMAGRYAVQASYALRIDDNPGRTPDGNDADNKNDHGRFWVQAIVWF